MREHDPRPDRREFLRHGAAALGGAAAVVLAGSGCRPARGGTAPGSAASAAGAAAPPLPPPASGPAPAGPAPGASTARARVVLVRDRAAVDANGALRAPIIARMLDEAVTALLGVGDPLAAWRRLVTPADRVGVKTNVWKYLSTTTEVEGAITARLVSAGVPRDAITIDDRGCRATLAGATALINARPLRTHHWAGIGGCIKNFIMFSPEPASYHPDSCADLAKVWSLPACAGKTRLNVLVALTPHFYGRGPHHFDARYVWPYGGIFVSRDPVAVDALGAHLLHLKRVAVFGEEKVGTPSHHIEYAETRHHLGVADRARIDLVRLGWAEEALL